MSDNLRYVPHPYKVRNANHVHKEEQQSQGFNTRVAVALTRCVGTMWTAYFFVGLAVIGLLGLLGQLNPFTFLFVGWLSQQLLQLVLLPVIMVGQNQQGHHQELQSEETYQASQKTFKDVEAIMEQNNKQFEMLEAQNKVLETHYLELLRQTSMLNTALTPRRRPMKQVEGKE